MRIFKTKDFSKWAKKAKINDKSLIKSANEVDEGLIDAKLSANLIKKRVPVGSQGKRSGARVILAYKKGKNIFFLFGFEKNEKDNINKSEHETLSIVGNSLISMSSEMISKLKKEGKLIELGGNKNG